MLSKREIKKEAARDRQTDRYALEGENGPLARDAGARRERGLVIGHLSGGQETKLDGGA